MTDARKPSEKSIKWAVEHRGRVGNLSDQPQYFIAEHPCGAELHVWISTDDVDRFTEWFFEVKGKYSAFNTPFAYEGGSSADKAKAAALEYITERVQEVANEIAAAWSK